MKIHHISDSHGYHDLLKIDESCEIVIHSGDESNSKDPYKNEGECREFLEWYSSLSNKYKLFIPGNHSTAIEKGLVKKKDFEDYNIIYLENDYVTIDGIKFFGSPQTPTFGNNWAFNKARANMDEHWSKVDSDVDVFITHGPPKTILDLAYDVKNNLEHCGCNALKRHLLERVKPKLSLFGHIHNNDDIINAGVLKLSAYDTIFSNGSVVTDGKFGKVSSNGNILEI